VHPEKSTAYPLSKDLFKWNCFQSDHVYLNALGTQRGCHFGSNETCADDDSPAGVLGGVSKLSRITEAA
jgi:hypothetical protein